MKALKHYLIPGLSLLVLSCAKTERGISDSLAPAASKSISTTGGVLSEEELIRLVLFEENNTYSPQEVIGLADGLPDRMKGAATYSTRTAQSGSTANPVIKQVWDVPNAAATRSNSSPVISSKIYLLGYENLNGFCMIADDKRLSNPVLMYSDEGDAGLPTDQPGFKYVMDILKSFVSEQVASVEAMREDSIYRNMAARYDIMRNGETGGGFILTDRNDGTRLTVSEEQINEAFFADPTASAKNFPDPPAFTGPNWTFPKLTENWGQGAPFNGKSPNEYAGCNAVAVGMVLHNLFKTYTSENQHTIPGVTAVIAAKYQWKGYYNNWNEWPSGNSNAICQDVAQLMYDINSPQNLAATYFYDGNGTGAPIENCTRTFRNMGTLANDCTAYNAEKMYAHNGGIAVVGGKVAGTTYGHTWVVDSMARVNGTLYAHCNWGYNGTGNGMCNANAFQRAGQQYTQNLKMIRNIIHTRRR